MTTIEPRLELGGAAVSTLDQPSVIQQIIDELKRGVGGWVVTLNIDDLRIMHQQAEVRELLRDVELPVADGMPLVWASRLLGHPLPGRVTGSELIFELTAAAAAAGVGVMLVGGEDGVAATAAARLRAACPGLRIGWHYPPHGFEKHPAQREAIDQSLRDFGPAIVFVGLGFPKQERLISSLRSVAPGSWFIGVGAALDFAAGNKQRAPRLVQRLGLEWMHRLVAEPRRLASRYLVEDVPFAIRLLTRSFLDGRRGDADRTAEAPAVGRTIVSTVDGPWPDGVRILGRRGFTGDLITYIRVGRSADAVVILGSVPASKGYVDLLVGVVLRYLPRGPQVIILDATWEPTSRSVSRGNAMLRRLVEPAVKWFVRRLDSEKTTYCVLSTYEAETFAANWGVRNGSVRFTPYSMTIRGIDEQHRSDQTAGSYIFAGGDPMRDYPLLLRAHQASDVALRIASRELAPRSEPGLVVGPLSPAAYDEAMLGAGAVVVPLRRAQRSAGHQTYLNAMAAGKAVIVTDAPGVRDHVEDGVTGFVVAPDAAALREKMRWIMRPENAEEVAAVAAAGAEAVRREFSEERYFERVLALAVDASSR